jgi:hypothetical protein
MLRVTIPPINQGGVIACENGQARSNKCSRRVKINIQEFMVAFVKKENANAKD